MNIIDDFKLYDDLVESVKNIPPLNDLTPLVEKLKRLDPLGYQIVAMIIKKHELSITREFNNQKLNNGLAKFDIRDFDPLLQNILLEFCTRHFHKINNINP